MQAQNAMACGSNLAIGMGIMGGLMSASLAKLVLDAELVNYTKSYYRSINLTPDGIAADVIAEMPFDGNYVTTTHTLSHCRKEHYAPSLFERLTSDMWADGPHEAFMEAVADRINQELAAYNPPDVDEALARELDRIFTSYLSDNQASRLSA